MFHSCVWNYVKKFSFFSYISFYLINIPFLCNIQKALESHKTIYIYMFCLIQERGSAFSSLIWFFEHFSHVRIWYLIKSSNLDFCTLFSFHHSFWIAFQKHHIRTGCGYVSVIVYEDPDKPTLITYPDLAPNCKHCQFIFFYIVQLV